MVRPQTASGQARTALGLIAAAGLVLAGLLAPLPAAAQHPTAQELLNILDSAVRKDIVAQEAIGDWTAFSIQTFPAGGTRPIQACALAHRGPAHALDYYEVRYPIVVDGYRLTGRRDRLVLRAGAARWDYTRKWTMEMRMNLVAGSAVTDRQEVFFTPLPIFETHFVGEFLSHAPRDILDWLNGGSALGRDARLVAQIEGREITIPLAHFGAALGAFEQLCDGVFRFNAEALR